MTYRSLLKGIQSTFVTAGVAIGLVGCPGDDGGDDGMNATSNPTTPMTDGNDDGDPTMDSTGAEECLEDPSVSFATDVQPIIEANCVNSAAGLACHATGGSWDPYKLDGNAATNYNAIVNAKSTQIFADPDAVLVKPCSLDESYLWAKLTGDGVAAGLCKMPISEYPIPTGQTCADVETSLPSADLDTIEAWILGGAPM